MFPRTLTTLAVSAALLASTPLRADDQSSDRAPVQCVSVARVAKTDVIDDQTILFFMRGGKQIYQSHLPRKCPGLELEDRFAYRVTTGQLCSIDTIKTLPRLGSPVTCGLGEFQPITADQAEELRAAHEGRAIEAKPAQPPKESATAAPAHE